MEISSSKHPFKKVLILVLGRVSDMKFPKTFLTQDSDQTFSERHPILLVLRAGISCYLRSTTAVGFHHY